MMKVYISQKEPGIQETQGIKVRLSQKKRDNV